MLWVTLGHVHLDRVAAPWLVKRFVDPDAEFGFVPWGEDGHMPTPALLEQVPEGATPLGMPGAELGLHDKQGSCFHKVLERYELRDPALRRMDRIVACGIRHAFGEPQTGEETEEELALGYALDELGSAFGVLYSDAEHLANAFPMYDAVLARCRIAELPQEVRDAAPFLPPQRGPYLAAAISRGS
jgi:hypothetical protein